MIEYLTEQLRELTEELECFPFHLYLYDGNGRSNPLKVSALRHLITGSGNAASGSRNAYFATHRNSFITLNRDGETELATIGSKELVTNYLEILKEHDEYRRALFAFTHGDTMPPKKKRVNITIR